MKMLTSVYEPAVKSGTPEDIKLAEKLSREYILNLSLCRETPRNERAESVRILSENSGLMESASGVYAKIGKLTKIAGIPFTAELLYILKCVKRFSRYIKQRRNGNGN